MRLVSIIIPIYNEEQNVPLIHEAVVSVWDGLKDNYSLEIIFVNDGSRDGSQAAIERLARNDERVRFVDFTRNFGKEMATTAGLIEARGDAAIMIDADLQHPPAVIPVFLEKWEQGASVVSGVRKNGNGKGFVGHFLSSLFYKMINTIGETHLMPSSTDFRLVDRQVIEEFKRFGEQGRITRGLLDWLGFPTVYVEFEVAKRAHGQAAYSLSKLFGLALSAFISHSLFPLKFSGYLGLIMTILSGMLGLFIFFEKYIFNDPFNFHFSGPAILAVINLFLIGIVLMAIGIIGLYVGSIQRETLGRPMFVVRNRTVIK